MNSKIDQTLLKAVEAHKSGKPQEAEQLYRAILKIQPKHPDANHNLGILLVGLGKSQEALTYLKTALENSPMQGQFWVSYIHVLIEAKEIAKASTVLTEGKKKGLAGEAIKQLEQKLVAFQTNKSSPSQTELDALLASYNAGDFDLARETAQKLTLEYPMHPFGWKVLGAIFSHIGDFEKALIAMHQAATINPMDAQTYSNIGKILRDLGRLTEAEDFCRKSIKISPTNAESYNNLAVTLRDMGKYADAEIMLRKAIEIKPDYAEAFCNLGSTLLDLERFPESKNCYSTAVHLAPMNAHFQFCLANAFKKLECLNEAEITYKAAIKLNPTFQSAYSNLANTLIGLNRFSEAEEFCRAALTLNKNDPQALSNLGAILCKLDRLHEAELSCRHAIQLNPDSADAYSNLGSILTNLGRLSAAEASYREAIRLKPNYTATRSNLLFSLNYIESLSPAAALVEAQLYGSLISVSATPKFNSWLIEANPVKLRIGFVSGDLKNHPVGYFIEGLLKHLDPNQFEIYAFPTTPETDDLTERLKPHFEKWLPIYGKADLEAATLIHAHGIQILIDLSGHTAHNRLPVFSYKPAPVQASWLGYFATTGLPEMDYFLGDPYMSPQSDQHHFTEKIWNLAETWLCLIPPVQPVSPSSLPALSNHYLTFGCLGNLSKMNDQVVKLWATILKKVPHSKLLLKSRQLADSKVISDVQNRFAIHDLSIDRLILKGSSSRTEYFQTYNQVDIVLDTFPYPGGTTSVDALWMSTPVLTLKGNRFLSRLGESIAINAGQTNWIAQDYDDYVNKAIEFASDLQTLAILRNTLRDKVLKTVLFDTRRFAKNFEDTLHGMWNQGIKKVSVMSFKRSPPTDSQPK